MAKDKFALTDAAKWLADNRLVINVSKYKFITIENPKRVENFNLFKLPIISSYGQSQISDASFGHDAILPSCTSTNLLGVVIDNNLSFKDHINNLQTKLAPKLGKTESCFTTKRDVFTFYVQNSTTY